VGDKWDEAPERHRPLMELATRQHGVVSTRQLKVLGYGRNSASKANKVGRLHRIHRGVYVVGHRDLTWRGEYMAAVLACAPAVVSHSTACRLLGLFQTSSTLHLTVPSKRRPRRPFRFHIEALSQEDLAEADGIPVTSLERTHLDIAARWPSSLPGMLEAAEDSKRFDLRKFEALLARTSRHPGHGPLRKALRVYRPDPMVLRSDLERDFRALIRDANLPLPSHNFNVGPYELDCYWPDHRFCVELDTFATHGSRRSFEEDRKRERELRRLGVEIERVTDLQLESEPEEVLAAVAESLKRRAPTTSRAPTGR
jgi:very-short-patch-repair endonuclease